MFIIICVLAAAVAADDVVVVVVVAVVVKITDDLTVIHILQSHLNGCSDTGKSMVHGCDLHKCAGNFYLFFY